MRERTRARGRSRETVKEFEEWADPLFAEAKQIPKIERERGREREIERAGANERRKRKERQRLKERAKNKWHSFPFSSYLISHIISYHLFVVVVGVGLVLRHDLSHSSFKTLFSLSIHVST